MKNQTMMPRTPVFRAAGIHSSISRIVYVPRPANRLMTGSCDSGESMIYAWVDSAIFRSVAGLVR